MADTTIGVSEEVKDMLEEKRRDQETWNGLLMRLVEEHNEWTEEEIRSIARQESKDMIRQYQ